MDTGLMLQSQAQEKTCVHTHTYTLHLWNTICLFLGCISCKAKRTAELKWHESDEAASRCLCPAAHLASPIFTRPTKAQRCSLLRLLFMKIPHDWVLINTERPGKKNSLHWVTIWAHCAIPSVLSTAMFSVCDSHVNRAMHILSCMRLWLLVLRGKKKIYIDIYIYKT